MKLLAALLALLGFSGQPVSHAEYAAGQVWEYHVRPGEEGSLLKIQKIEADPRGAPIYHISLIGLHLAGVPQGDEVQHLPVSKATLDASVTRLSHSTAAFPDPSEGIEIWRKDHGGVFTISVVEILEVIEKSIAQSGKSE